MAKNRSTQGRDPTTGKFAPGNKAAVGKGRPPAQARRVIHELLYAEEVHIGYDEKGKGVGRAISLVEKARLTIDRAMSGRDAGGNATSTALQAARDVLNRAYGLPHATMDLKISNTDTLLDDLDTAAQQAELDALNEAAKQNRRLGQLNGHHHNGHANGKS